MITLYKNHINSIGTWSIMSRDNIIIIEHATTIGGAAVRHTEVVPEGKQGRSILQQVEHRITSRINKQLDKGYVETIAEAQVPPTNALDMKPPMLAQPIKRVSSFPKRYAVQHKFDGHRCLITKINGSLIGYSRQGKIIDTLEHIFDGIDIPEGTTLDGEIYLHGEKLQTIASWCKRLQKDTERLEYHVYDIISSEPFKNRHEILKSFYLAGNIVLVPTKFVDSDDHDINEDLKQSIRNGYEGLILRNLDMPYESGRRSHGLIKVKQMLDDEFEVVGVRASKEGWAILDLKTAAGKQFSASAPGTHAEKRNVLENSNEFIGKLVTLEFSQWTTDGIPFHPVAIRFRIDL